MSDQYNKVREIALAKVFADFDTKLEESIGSFNETDISDDDIETVRGKYRNAFQNFFTTGFDIIFQKEFLDKISDEKGTSQKVSKCHVKYILIDLIITISDRYKGGR